MRSLAFRCTHTARILAAGFAFATAAACEESTVSNQPDQTVAELDADFLARLNYQREVVRAHLGEDPENLRKFDTAAGKLGAIRAILEAGVYDAEDTYELQCLGIVLGDAFAQELQMQWVIVTDEYGSDPALRDADNPNIIIFPLTMISKRIERGEDLDVFELFNGIAAEVDKMRSDLES